MGPVTHQVFLEYNSLHSWKLLMKKEASGNQNPTVIIWRKSCSLALTENVWSSLTSSAWSISHHHASLSIMCPQWGTSWSHPPPVSASTHLCSENTINAPKFTTSQTSVSSPLSSPPHWIDLTIPGSNETHYMKLKCLHFYHGFANLLFQLNFRKPFICSVKLFC